MRIEKKNEDFFWQTKKNGQKKAKKIFVWWNFCWQTNCAKKFGKIFCCCNSLDLKIFHEPQSYQLFLGFLLSVYLVYLWPGYLTELGRLSWTIPHTFTNCLLGYWNGMQHIWYQCSKSYLIYFAGVVCVMHCTALVNQSNVGQKTVVLISKNIVHRTKAAVLETEFFSNQDKETISFLSIVGQISSNIQSLCCVTQLSNLLFG